MIKKITSSIFLTAFTCYLSAQVNVELLGHLTYPDQLSNLCAWADGSGNEYAIVGTEDGTSIVDVTDPTDPNEVQFIDGVNSIWREIRVWDHYAYVVTEGGGGLLCIDLSGLPSSVDFNFTDGGVGLNSGHTVFCDENGFVHVFGSNIAPGGDQIFDANVNPMDPEFAGAVGTWYIHDGFVRGDTLWAGNIYEGQFSVWDISDKTSPVLLASQITPYEFTHNTWLSDDGNYIYTTDEVTNATVASYDVSDLTDIQELDQFRANPGTSSIPHNTMVVGNFLVTAYYRDGVIITDVTHPDNMIKTGWYDTSPLTGNGFNGCWGSWPYLPSGIIVAADMEEGLFVLGPTYVQACYLQGTVTDLDTGDPIYDVTVDVTPIPGTEANTDLTGQYNTGYYLAGTYDITFSKPGFYLPTTITGVSLENGVTTIVDAQLAPLPTLGITGHVTDAVTGEGIAFADVLLENDLYNFSTVCDADGNFTYTSIYDTTYTLYAGKWGHVTNAIDLDAEAGADYSIELTKGYYDDFTFQNDWVSAGSAETGLWVRDVPLGTSAGGGAFANPNNDVMSDYLDLAYMTGNNGEGGASVDDVDNGDATLTSPVMDLTGYEDPHLTYYRWFYNGGGATDPNDSLKVFISNGIETVFVDEIDNSSDEESMWLPIDILIKNYLDLTDNMTVMFYTADQPATGHLVEAGLDLFTIYDNVTAAPTASFDADVKSGCAPLTVEFTDMSVGATSWSWEFEGGTPSTSILENPVVSYSTPGVYSVTLTATNDLGSNVATTEDYITVELCNGIDELEANGIFDIAPNPFTEFTLISFTCDFDEAVMRMTDITGRIISDTEVAKGENHIAVGGSMPAGVYFISLLSGTELISTGKIVKSE